MWDVVGGQQRVGSRYVIETVLGQGAFGQVWAARDVDGGQWAVKVLRPELASDPGVVRGFVQERSVLASVRHRHVVGVHDLVAEGTTLAIVMDLVDGPDLRSLLRARGTVAPATAARWGAQVAAGLAAAHAVGVVHRDVKPENVLIDAASDEAKLTDFGIARLMDASSQTATMLAGTPQYMSPEVAEGDVSGAAGDLYSLGAMVYELACGVPPFAGRGSALATLRAHAHEVAGRPPQMPDPLWPIVEELLAKDPGRRPSSAAEVSRRLSDVAEELAGVPAAERLSAPPPSARVITGAPDAPTMVGMQAVRSGAPASRHPVPGSPSATPVGGLGQNVFGQAAEVDDGWDEPRPSKRLMIGLVGVGAGLLLCAGVAAAVIMSGEETPASAGEVKPTVVPSNSASPMPASMSPGSPTGAPAGVTPLVSVPSAMPGAPAPSSVGGPNVMAPPGVPVPQPEERSIPALPVVPNTPENVPGDQPVVENPPPGERPIVKPPDPGPEVEEKEGEPPTDSELVPPEPPKPPEPGPNDHEAPPPPVDPRPPREDPPAPAPGEPGGSAGGSGAGAVDKPAEGRGGAEEQGPSSPPS